MRGEKLAQALLLSPYRQSARSEVEEKIYLDSLSRRPHPDKTLRCGRLMRGIDIPVNREIQSRRARLPLNYDAASNRSTYRIEKQCTVSTIPPAQIVKDCPNPIVTYYWQAGGPPTRQSSSDH